MTESPGVGPIMLRDALTIPEVVAATDFVLQLQTGVQDASATVGEYVVTSALAQAFDEALGYVEAGLAGRKDQGVFIHGSFGSGKSHFMAVLDLMLRGEQSARALSGLQAVVAGHRAALEAKLLTLEYHLIGATSLEQALFSGYLATMHRLHPDAPLPLLHKSDALLADARGLRDQMGEAFFVALNAGEGGGWGDLAGTWDAASFDAAVSAAAGDPERQRLAQDLVATMFKGYVAAGEWVSIDQGLGVIAAHAQRLGYQGVVLFLDELVLWLANHLADREFVATEGSKVAKLVETGIGQRAVPLISFVARQRDLADFLGDTAAGMAAGGAIGAERLAVGQAFQWWEDRFDKITLAASDLPEIANRRLLTPRDDAGGAALAGALQRLKANRVSWDALLAGDAQADEAAFAKVYPFSPALVDTLVVLSSLLQRERTALKVMAHLLVNGRAELTVDDVIPVGDLYDVMVEGGDQPLTEEMRQHFGHARALYREKLRPQLLQQHALTEEQAAALPRTAPFRHDDRLAKTLLIAAIAPQSTVLRGLTAGRIAALNHGSVKAMVPGQEATQVLSKVKSWAETVGEIHIGEGPDPVITLELAGVDYDSILEKVANEDTESARRTLLKRLVYTDLGINDDTGVLRSNTWNLVWRGSKRSLDVVFGNIRDESALPDDLLRADGDAWKVIIDYPFDSGDHGPQEDVNRIRHLSAGGLSSRTVAWVPMFLTQARQDDLGKLVQLEHLLGGLGDQFERNAAGLPVEQRQIARTALENLRRTLTDRLAGAIKQAYGVARREPADVDLESYGDVETFPTLAEGLVLQPPVGATLKDALANLADQMLTSQYPEHPRFEPSTSEVTTREIGVVYEYVRRSREAEGGRVDPVEREPRTTLRRVANALKVGECYENHYVFDTGLFPWRNLFLQGAAKAGLDLEIPVAQMRSWLAPYGLSRQLENLLIASWALLDDKQFALHGASTPVPGPEGVRDEFVLRDPALPDQEVFDSARERAAKVFGVPSAPLRTAAVCTALAVGIRTAAVAAKDPCARLESLLTTHAHTLALAGDAPRLATATTGAELTRVLAGEQDDLVLLTRLAEAPLPDEPEPLGTSIATATQVAAGLAAATWPVLDAVARRTDDTTAVSILQPLRNAAAAQEMHLKLVPVLTTATRAAADFLAGDPVPPPPPPPVDEPDVPDVPGVRTVDDITLEGLDDRVSAVSQEMRTALEANPGKKLRVKWWLE